MNGRADANLKFKNTFPYNGPRKPIHIFTDSMYTYNAGTSTTFQKQNFHLIQEIRNFGHQLGQRSKDQRPTLHYVPSHIEDTSLGKKYTGNYYADILATRGRLVSSHDDKSKYLHVIRERMLTATIELLYDIDKKLQIFREPDGPPANADDLGASRLCQLGSSHEDPMT